VDIGAATPAFGDSVHLMSAGLLRIPIFPLAGALLFPRTHLPLHIFEPRYREMVRDALAGDKLIAMVQPRDGSEPPPVFEIGCIGQIVEANELDDGRYNIVLEGLTRFRIASEADVTTPYRQVDADRSGFEEDGQAEPLEIAQRAELEQESKAYAEALGYVVDWTAVTRLDDELLVNSIAQIVPLDPGAKQALLEADDVAARADLLVQFMQFQRMLPSSTERPETLQ
jgi:Lon protease-like protein